MKSLTNAELTTFCNQFALILQSGISSTEGLSIMLEDTPQGEGRQLLETLLLEVEATGSLYMALGSVTVFPTYMRSMVELGEQSGQLDDVMANLAGHYRREDQLAKSIKSAVTYPLVMLAMMITVMIVLIVKVMPVFNQVFEQLGTSLTGISGTVMQLGSTLGNYSVIIVAVILLLTAVFLYFIYHPKGRSKAISFSRYFFMTKGLSEKIARSRFASGMHLAISSGLATDQSLELVTRLVEHPAMSEKIRQMQEDIAAGSSFAAAAQEAKIFSGIYSRMIHIGFKTGTMDDIMKQIATQYEEEIEEQMNGLIAKLEPTLVAILSIAVGMILLSVMLPLMGIMSQIG